MRKNLFSRAGIVSLATALTLASAGPAFANQYGATHNMGLMYGNQQTNNDSMNDGNSHWMNDSNSGYGMDNNWM